MTSFGDAERRIAAYFHAVRKIQSHGEVYSVVDVGKPTCYHGEPKTDIYVLLDGSKYGKKEIKISYKKENADFLENKINNERAEQIFGYDWKNIIISSTRSISNNFYNRMLVYKEKFSHTQRGSITLGWKFELVNKQSGDLSGRMTLSHQQIKDIYAGTHLSAEKRNASVNGKVVRDSGVANYVLISDNVENAEDVLNEMIPIDEYATNHPNIYFACKALNYRTLDNKYDGNRPLAVQVNWGVNNGMMDPVITFDNPLEQNGDEMASRLLKCMEKLGIHTTDDINASNINVRYVYGG